MSEQPIEVRRLNTALERILRSLNDALNRPPSEITLLAELRAQLVVARKIAAEQNLSERDALIQAASAAQSFEQLERDIATEEQAPALPTAPSPQRTPYTLADAETVFADSQVMAEQLVFQRTGRQPDRATQRAIGAYLVDNLFSEQRGVPDGLIEGFAEQVVALQGETITRNPESATQGRRFQGFINALLDSDNPSASIDLETYRALVFPATPLADVPVRFRGGDVPSLAAQAQAEAKALDVINNLSNNMLVNLQKVVDIARGPTGVTNFGEAAVRVVAAQTEEEVVAGTATLPSVGSPSRIRAQRRETAAFSALEDETSTKKAVEDIVGSPGLLTDADEQKRKTQAVRRVTDTVQNARRVFLLENPGATKEEIAAHLAPILAQETEPEAFAQILSEVAQEVGLLKLSNLEDTKKELKAILGRASKDASAIDDGLLTQVAQFVMESGDPVQMAQSIVGAFSGLEQESARLKDFATLDDAIAAVGDIFGQVGQDVSLISPEFVTGLAQAGIQAGGLDARSLQAAFPQFRQAQIESEQAEEVAEARTAGGAKSLLNQALFDLGERPQDFTPEQLNAFSQFIAQSGGVQDFERVVGPQFEQLKQDKVLQETLGGGRGGGAQQFGGGAFPTFEQLGAMRSVDLGVAPTGQIAPLPPGGLRQTPTTVRGNIAAQLGQSGFALPFANIRSQTELRDIGDVGPLFRETAGDSPAFLSFLRSRRASLQGAFGAEGRGQVRRERARLQQIGRNLSEAQSDIRSAFRGASLSREGDIRRGLTGEAPARGGAELATLRRRDAQLTRRIETTSVFQREAGPSGTFEEFFGGRIGGLREAFGRTPAGLRETAEATQRRRRSLRGGRTIFRRI